MSVETARLSASRHAVVVRTFDQHVVADRGEVTAIATPIVRKSADSLNATEQRVFKKAIISAIKDGIYSTLVRIHAVMSHDMHTMAGMAAGTERFLPWHRLYLINFEQAMRAF